MEGLASEDWALATHYMARLYYLETKPLVNGIMTVISSPPLPQHTTHPRQRIVPYHQESQGLRK